MMPASIRLSLSALLFSSLLAGCQSERVAFRIAPPARAVAATPGETLTPATAAVPAETVLALASGPARQVAQAATSRPRSVPATISSGPQLQLPAQLKLRLATLAPARHPAPMAQVQARPAENGLGGIFFFFLGVLLAVLTGLSFGVAAIFGISFWLALGYAAGGLLVLGLLYGLFKKKPKI